MLTPLHILLFSPLLLIAGYVALRQDAARRPPPPGYAFTGQPHDFGLYGAVMTLAGVGFGFFALLLIPTLSPVWVLAFGIAGIILARIGAMGGANARSTIEKCIHGALLGCAVVAIITTAGIVLSLVFESALFFRKIPAGDFLLGLHWSPQSAVNPNGTANPDKFGFIPLLAGTLLITGIALLVAVPTGLMAAIYMSEYASSRLRMLIKPVLEILAGIPTVVYGFFAITFVAPLVRDFGASANIPVSTESALAAGLVMGIMIIPFMSSLADDVISAVPQRLRDGSLGLGATSYETIRHVVLPTALPGIVGAFLLAFSRAVGETMIVVMAAGMGANLTANPLESVTTVTVQIVKLLVGDQEFSSPKTLAAFALGLTLFGLTLLINLVALTIVRRYRKAEI